MRLVRLEYKQVEGRYALYSHCAKAYWHIRKQRKGGAMKTVPVNMTSQGWDTVATAYDRIWAPYLELYAEDAIRLAGVRSGDRVLDVAAGPGTLTLLAAKLGAQVTATDFSPAMIEQLRKHVASQGLANVTAKVMDGQALKLPDNSFDSAFSNFGLIFFPDRAQGFRELYRVIRPGGKAIVTGWSVLERVEIIAAFARAIKRALPDLPPPASPPAALSLQDPQVFEHEMRGAGFSEVRIHSISHAWEASSPEVLWESSQGTPALTTLLESLDLASRRAVRDALFDILRQQFVNGPSRFSQEAHIGVGTKEG
jgi:ubiquinone/menaquinone biosynthesis C-methylase UbiE